MLGCYALTWTASVGTGAAHVERPHVGEPKFGKSLVDCLVAMLLLCHSWHLRHRSCGRRQWLGHWMSLVVVSWETLAALQPGALLEWQSSSYFVANCANLVCDHWFNVKKTTRCCVKFRSYVAQLIACFNVSHGDVSVQVIVLFALFVPLP